MSKELNKAPVEQAGGDERAVDGKPRATKCPGCGEGDLMPGDLCACGYETDPAAGYACSECDGSGDGYVGELCRECDGSGWFVTPEQARAALAQPSPPPHPASELDFSRPLETENGDPVKWICADVIEYKSARVCVAKDTGLVYSSPYIGLKIRNVMPEQAEAERPEGPTEDELEAAGLGYPLHKEEAVKLWYSGFRSEVITVLEAWEAIGHDIGMNPDKGELLDSLRYMLEKCEAHDAALARVAELERQQPVAWMHDQPNRVDVIHRDVKDLLQRVPGSSRGIYRPLDVSEHYTIPLYAAPVAQAQHSVPDELRAICMLVAETGIKYGGGRHRAVAADECRAVVNAVLNADLSVGRACEYAGCCEKAHPGTSLCIAHHSKKAREQLLAAAPQQGGRS